MTMESAVMAASLATPAQRVEGVPKGADAGGASGRGTEEAIAFNDVTVRFTTERGTVTALENIAFSIQRGSFLTGAFRLRQVHAAARDRRPDPA